MVPKDKEFEIADLVRFRDGLFVVVGFESYAITMSYYVVVARVENFRSEYIVHPSNLEMVCRPE